MPRAVWTIYSMVEAIRLYISYDFQAVMVSDRQNEHYGDLMTLLYRGYLTANPMVQ